MSNKVIINSFLSSGYIAKMTDINNEILYKNPSGSLSRTKGEKAEEKGNTQNRKSLFSVLTFATQK